MGEAVQGCTPARLFIMADNATKIATLQAILDAGAAGVSVDGESVTYDLAAIRKEIREPVALWPHKVAWASRPWAQRHENEP